MPDYLRKVGGRSPTEVRLQSQVSVNSRGLSYWASKKNIEAGSFLLPTFEGMAMVGQFVMVVINREQLLVLVTMVLRPRLTSRLLTVRRKSEPSVPNRLAVRVQATLSVLTLPSTRRLQFLVFGRSLPNLTNLVSARTGRLECAVRHLGRLRPTLFTSMSKQPLTLGN